MSYTRGSIFGLYALVSMITTIDVDPYQLNANPDPWSALRDIKWPILLCMSLLFKKKFNSYFQKYDILVIFVDFCASF